jgi:hypothetical protein
MKCGLALPFVLTSIVVPMATAVLTAVVTALLTFAVQERRLKREYMLDFMAETAARTLLESKQWEKRSFKAIEARLGGFTEDELRKVLVRAGAVRFKGANGQELWGLLKLNKANPED